jgi:hypothetical protein
MLGRCRAATTGTPSVTTLPHGTWAPWMATIGTTADPTWTPLVVNPPYPDYPSGHACLTGATANGLSYLLGPQNLDLVVSSAVTGTTRHYLTEDTLNQDTMNARVWLGIHFRKAVVDGNRLGHQVSRWHCGTTSSPSTTTKPAAS